MERTSPPGGIRIIEETGLMHVAVACGGTGGHIFPGLATAAELKRRGHDVTLWLAGKDVENEAVKGWEGRVITVPAQGFPSSISISSVKTTAKLLRAVHRVKSAMSAERPDVVLAMGSYASIGPGLAARMLKIPLVIHESNVIPGRAVRFLAPFARVVACCFEETRFHLRKRNLMITGMPLRPELVTASRSPRPSSAQFRLLIMGGSRGAHRINEIASRAVIELHAAGLPVSVMHLTGEKDRAEIAARYRENGVVGDVMSFTRDMGGLYNRADFAICRAGAATCAELLTFGLPSLLVPYPYAIKDHQTENARALEKAGCADMVPERDLAHEWLISYIRQMMLNRERCADMAQAAKKRSSIQGAENLAALVEKQVETAIHE